MRPFVAGSVLNLGETGQDDFTGKPGLDVFYSITPSLRLTGTVNTDFAETEVDERQINLTRFPLLFPEKRAFFPEDAGVFSFASTGPEPPGGIPPAGADVYPFFSRRIGLLEGEEVPIDVGAKLTGRIGRSDVGVLAVRTGELADVVEPKSLVVARLKWKLFQQSYAGVLFTGGDPASGESGQTYGADLRLTTSRFLGGARNFDVTAYAARSVNVTPLDWHFNSGDSIHALVDFNARYERLFAPFEISPAVVLPPGEYRFSRFGSFFASAAKRRLSGSFGVNWGDYWSGKAEELRGSLTGKLPPWLTPSVDLNKTFARLPEGDFTATIVTSRIEYSVSPRLSFSNLIQYDNRSRNLGWPSRFRWTLQPGSDFPFVFNQGWVHEEDDLRFRPQDSKVPAKIEYTFRF